MTAFCLKRRLVWPRLGSSLTGKLCFGIPHSYNPDMVSARECAALSGWDSAMVSRVAALSLLWRLRSVSINGKHLQAFCN